jgi:hypothetical protein
MLSKSLFICYSTPNYSELTDICLNSIRDLNVSDDRINHLLDTPPIPLIGGFGSELWYYCVRNKINHLVNVLNNYENYTDISYFIFTDCDIHYKQKNKHEWSNLEEYIENGDKDIYFMGERNPERDVNSGFFIIKNNENIRNIINFFSEVVETFDITDKNDMCLGDQTIVNNLKHKLNWGYVPDEYIIAGPCRFDRNKCLIHHSTSATTVEIKIQQMKYVNSQL